MVASSPHTSRGPRPRRRPRRRPSALRVQVRRVIDADVALRNEPRVIRRALEDLGTEPEPDWAPVPPDEPLPITPVATPADIPVGTLSAVADLIDLDFVFYLFVHVRTDEAVVVYRRDDGRIGLLFPRGSLLADENDIVVPRESWYTEPQPVENIRDQMDLAHHRFLYFTDVRGRRGEGPVPPPRGRLRTGRARLSRVRCVRGGKRLIQPVAQGRLGQCADHAVDLLAVAH